MLDAKYLDKSRELKFQKDNIHLNVERKQRNLFCIQEREELMVYIAVLFLIFYNCWNLEIVNASTSRRFLT